MNTRAKSTLDWLAVRRAINEAGGNAAASIPKVKISNPRDAGARPTATWPAGQLADYALDGPPSEAPLVVREFTDRYEAFLDGARLVDMAATAAEDNPTAALYVGGALLGGAIGTSVTNRREGALLGAGLGLLFAALMDASMDRHPRRR